MTSSIRSDNSSGHPEAERKPPPRRSDVPWYYRTGGETVYLCNRHPNGVTEAQYEGILADNPKAKGGGWRMMRRNPGVYVRGRVRHADLGTIILHG